MRKPKWVTVLIAVLALVLTLALPAVGQVTEEAEQEGESGEVSQDFSATGGGDNSNACQNIQGTAQTGNSQNVIDLIQYESTTDDFEFEETGSTLTESPTNTATCDQQVNQAASAAA